MRVPLIACFLLCFSCGVETSNDQAPAQDDERAEGNSAEGSRAANEQPLEFQPVSIAAEPSSLRLASSALPEVAGLRITEIANDSIKIDWERPRDPGVTAIHLAIRYEGARTFEPLGVVTENAAHELPTSFYTLIKPCLKYEILAQAELSSKALGPAKAATLAPSKNRMWVWSDDADLLLPSARAGMISWGTTHQVDTLYVAGNYWLDGTAARRNALAALVAEAYAANIGVMLAYGNTNWHNPASWPTATTKIQNAVAFIMNQGAYAGTGLPANQRLGIMLDSEVWAGGWQGVSPLTDWNVRASNWLTLLANLRTEVHGAAFGNPNKLRFAVAIPSWLDTTASNCPPSTSGCPLAWNSATKLLSNHVIDMADGTLVMAYDQSAASITNRATNEVLRGNLVCKRIDVGVETRMSLSDPGQTFYGISEVNFDIQTAQVRSTLAPNYGFGGIAVDSFLPWVALP
jgi:hypothetical protein